MRKHFITYIDTYRSCRAVLLILMAIKGLPARKYHLAFKSVIGSEDLFLPVRMTTSSHRRLANAVFLNGMVRRYMGWSFAHLFLIKD